MRILFTAIAVLTLGAMLVSGSAWADDSAEIADLQARIATLEASMMAPSGGGDAESLTSLRKNGTVRIGGKVEMGASRASIDKTTENDNRWVQEGIANPGKPPNSARIVSSDIYDADLDIRVDAGPDTHLDIKLDLDDTSVDGDLVEEAIFVWENVRGYPWTVIFGKDEIFFGQDRSTGINELYNHGPITERGTSTSYLVGHTWDGLPGVGEIDNTIHLGLQYKYKELLIAEFSLFQAPGTSGQLSGIHNDHPEDDGLQSYAARLWYMPIEGLTLETSFISMHDGGEGANEPADDATSRRIDSENVRAVSVGAEYETGNWDMYGEYIHTWDADFREGLDVDVITLGIAYGLTENIDLYLEGGWEGIDNEVNRLADEFEEDLYMGVIGAIYTFDNGIYLQGEFVREWYSNGADEDNLGLGDIDDAQANVVNFVVGWEF